MDTCTVTGLRGGRSISERSFFKMSIFFPFFCKCNFAIRFTRKLQSYKAIQLTIKYFFCDIIFMIREIERR